MQGTQPPARSRKHALYRFYADDGALLYVGITLNPTGRWNDHRHDKPWWTDVADIKLETYPDCRSILEAERQAILAEKPRHNIVHNRQSNSGATISTPQLDRLDPFQPGDWIALGLHDGRCPVGEIVAIDDTWISVRLKNFLSGGISRRAIAVRWSEVERVEFAYPEDALTDPDQADDWREEHGIREAIEHGGRYMDDRHLGEFQTAWEQVHLGDSKDPVDAARAEVRRENYQRREGRP